MKKEDLLALLESKSSLVTVSEASVKRSALIAMKGTPVKYHAAEMLIASEDGVLSELRIQVARIGEEWFLLDRSVFDLPGVEKKIDRETGGPALERAVEKAPEEKVRE